MEKKKSLDTQPSQLCRKSEEKEEEGDPIFQTYIFSLIFVIISFPLCKRKFINKENTKILCSDFYSHLRDLRISLQPDLEDRFKNKYAITFVSSGYRDTWIYIYIFSRHEAERRVQVATMTFCITRRLVILPFHSRNVVRGAGRATVCDRGGELAEMSHPRSSFFPDAIRSLSISRCSQVNVKSVARRGEVYLANSTSFKSSKLK